MDITHENLADLFRGYQALYNEGMTAQQAASQWPLIAERVNSATSEETYDWLKEIPGLREWTGDRFVHALGTDGFRIVNKDYEDTVGVDTNKINDDRYGVLAPRFRVMGQAVARHPDQVLWAMLTAGFATACWDGQYFFDTDHPSLDGNGVATTRANTDGGSGTPWFLMASGALLKPLIWQVRQEGGFEQLTPEEYVRRNRRVEYGVHVRAAAGYGYWPAIWGSKQTLNATYYEAARVGIMAMKGDYDKPLGLMPDTLIVPPSLEKEALTLVNAEADASGATNVFRGTARLVVVPWLA